MVQLCRRMVSRERFGKATQVLVELLSFLFTDLMNHFLGRVRHVCARVHHRCFHLFQIRVVQRKQFGSAFVFSFSDKEK